MILSETASPGKGDPDADTDQDGSEKLAYADEPKKEREAQYKALRVPGYMVEQDGVFSVIRRSSTRGRSTTFPARIARWLVAYKYWTPALWRFTMESVALSPWRMAVLVLSRVISSLAPAGRLWATSKMLGIVEEAITTGKVRKKQLSALTVLAAILATGIGHIKVYFAQNAGILERLYESRIKSRLLAALARLDYQQLHDPAYTKIFSQASGILDSDSDQAFKLVGDVVKVFSSLLGVASQALLLRHCVSRNSLDLVVISLAAKIAEDAAWLFRGDAGVHSVVTNAEYLRMQSLYSQATDISAEEILLGLPAHYAAEYDKTDKRLGEVSTYRLLDKSRLARTTGFLQDIYKPVVYALFALRAASKRKQNIALSSAATAGAAGRAGLSFSMGMGGLAFLEQATGALASEIASFMYSLDDVRQSCTQILQFYRALDVTPSLKAPPEPVRYVTQVGRGSTPGTVVRGMAIEFRDVSFKYPGSEREALRSVSFSIKPGSLVCVVGYNGGGKSTLINLITRISDPASGQVLINGHDARAYVPSELYSRVACQYQQTSPAPVTLREWLHAGSLSDSSDDSDTKLWECLETAGVDGVVSRFPKKLEARLGPHPSHATAESALREYVEACEEGVVDPWEAGYTTRTAREEEEDEEAEDEVVGGAGAGGTGSLKGKDCAFSPGEWKKLCFARTLMKRDADLRIFDEPEASLDPLAARRVHEQIEALRGSATVVHITHNLSACTPRADQILMFEEGQLVEAGSHEELMAREGSKYRAFYLCETGRDVEESEGAAESDSAESSTASTLFDELENPLEWAVKEDDHRVGGLSSSTDDNLQHLSSMTNVTADVGLAVTIKRDERQGPGRAVSHVSGLQMGDRDGLATVQPEEAGVSDSRGRGKRSGSELADEQAQSAKKEEDLGSELLPRMRSGTVDSRDSGFDEGELSF